MYRFRDRKKYIEKNRDVKKEAETGRGREQRDRRREKE